MTFEQTHVMSLLPGDCSTPLESRLECRGLSRVTSVGVRIEPSLLVPTELKMSLDNKLPLANHSFQVAPHRTVG